MMANWLGGTYVNRDKKGDPNGRKPIVVVEVNKQRAALDFVIETKHLKFFDKASGLKTDPISL